MGKQQRSNRGMELTSWELTAWGVFEKARLTQRSSAVWPAHLAVSHAHLARAWAPVSGAWCEGVLSLRQLSMLCGYF